MKKLLLGLTIVLGVLVSGLNVSAQTIATMDYTKDPFYKAEDCVWATVNANYRYSEAYKLMNEVNKFRKENNMSELQTNDYCMQIAMQRALEYNILCDHSSPWESILGSPSLGCHGLFMEFAKNAITFIGPETCYGGFEYTDEVMSFINKHAGHNLEAGKAIGVGFVNDCAVIVIFSKEAALSAATNTGLTDYQTTMKVPVNKCWVEQGLAFTHDNVTIEGTEEDEEDKKEEAAKKEKKEVQSSKVSGVKLTKKKSGHTTKITVKFNKVKGCKYQIQVANNKQFKSAKKCSVSSNKKTVNVKYKGKKAYVRVRCYKVIDGKTVYGKWSAVKNIKTYK